MIQTLFSLALVLLVSAHTHLVGASLPWSEKALASHEFSLAKRYEDASVNDVFKDNILLTLAILKNGAPLTKPIDWNSLDNPGQASVTLAAGDVFAFHDSILPEYQGKRVRSIPAHYNAQDGFKSDGFLYGDGVCHLASLLNWVARDAGLGVESRVNHDFAPIAEVPREYGVSIYSKPTKDAGTALQNLYITNTRTNPIEIVFDYDGKNLRISIRELI